MKNNLNQKTLLNFDKPKNLYERFHQKTKIKRSLKILNPKYYPKSWTIVNFKGYSRFKEITLPKPKISKRNTLVTALQNRDSVRSYKKYKLSLQMISSLLYYSVGLKNINDPSLGRFYPSAGARYPIEIYLLSLNTNLSRGIYHYYFKNNSLEKIMAIDKFLFKKYLFPKEFRDASCFIIMTSIFNRSFVKYNLRAYPFVMMEAGHIGQNISLVSSSLRLGCCAIGGFNHYEIEKLLDIDGILESAIYIFAVGKKK